MTDIPPLISADAGILVGSNDLVRQVAAVAGKPRVARAKNVGGRQIAGKLLRQLLGSSHLAQRVTAVAGACWM